MKMIRVVVEVTDPNDSTYYAELPDDWDQTTVGEQSAYLTQCASEALYEHAGAAASVVEVDERETEVAA